MVWGNRDSDEDWSEGIGPTGNELYMEIHGLSLVEMHPEAVTDPVGVVLDSRLWVGCDG